MPSLTHIMEGVLDNVRSEKMPLSPEIAGSLLKGLDGLTALLEALKADVVIPEDSPLIDEIGGLRAGATSANGGAADSPAAKPADRSAIEAAMRDLKPQQGSNAGAYRIEVHLDPKSELRGVRAWQIFAATSAEGVWTEAAPPVDAPADQFDGEIVTGTWVGYLGADELRQRFGEIDDVNDLSVTDITAEDSRNCTPTPDNDARRITDLGPAARGLSVEDQMRLAKKSDKVSKAVRVDVERLDSLMNLTGELFIGRSRIGRASSAFRALLPGDPKVQQLEEASHRLMRLSDALQQEMMSIRMLPISTVVGKLPRVVRDLAQKLDKKIELVIDGAETELDRSIIESISDTLTHMIRNAIDHGIETAEERAATDKSEMAVVRLSAGQRDGGVVIEVSDDGRGIDPGRIKASALEKGIVTESQLTSMNEQQIIDLVLLPGFSTAKKVTDVSGRGVGMDVVRTTIEKSGGMVSIASTLGKGTTVSLRLPLTLAVSEALLVEVNKTTFAIPLDAISESLRLTKEETKGAFGRTIIRVRDRLLTVIDLRDEFSKHVKAPEREKEEEEEFIHVISVNAGSSIYALIVDRLIGHEAIVVKGLSDKSAKFAGVSGATILGDGSVGLILDVNALVRQSQSQAMRGPSAQAEVAA